MFCCKVIKNLTLAWEKVWILCVRYTGTFPPAETQSPYTAILMCSYDKILRNDGNICMLMYSNKVHIKSCFNERTSKGTLSEYLNPFADLDVLCLLMELQQQRLCAISRANSQVCCCILWMAQDCPSRAFQRMRLEWLRYKCLPFSVSRVHGWWRRMCHSIFCRQTWARSSTADKKVHSHDQSKTSSDAIQGENTS